MISKTSKYNYSGQKRPPPYHYSYAKIIQTHVVPREEALFPIQPLRSITPTCSLRLAISDQPPSAADTRVNQDSLYSSCGGIREFTDGSELYSDLPRTRCEAVGRGPGIMWRAGRNKLCVAWPPGGDYVGKWVSETF
ncbi:hypothetical protein AG1IA_08788 [Rhizoctonia solani AG-1 IA]|uniref:Uncharacterized protein n=1 Tax=Thanatephorus cucumeris (strain AG1-IA) TaxID=983506 RepID=L8WKA6_THACA|nr:hypothetical protein AG1IA_08788 [Rhizoctonia solani AG-1 IA]